MDDDTDHDLDTMFSAGYWDDRYAGVERTWSGRPNVRLVEQASDLAPGRALDLGAGEGGDARWLAERGWEVLALDISQVGLDRAAAHAPSDRITWRQADLRTWTPGADEAGFDLVTTCYLHLPPPGHPRLLGLLGDVVRPGGTLVHVGHHRDDIETAGRWDMAELMRPAAEVAADLDPDLWDVVRADDPTRVERSHHHDGGHAPVRDTVVVARRR